MADQDFDLSEEATPYKLEKAREQGSVAKSPDLTALAMLATMVGAFYAIGWSHFVLSMRLQQTIFSHITREPWTVEGIAAWLEQLAVGMLHILSPLFLALAITAILINLIQTGPVFSAKPLSPDMNRINPVTGFKKIFSLRVLYEAAKSVIKLLVLGWVAYLAIVHAIPGMLALSASDPKGYARLLLDLTAAVLTKMVLALLVIAIIDAVYTRWEYAKRMRMSRRDVKEESKQREGDPRIKARIRELRKEMLKRSKAMKQMPSADVLLTNPTHIAVALKYQHGESAAPKLIAKGAGELAAKMRQCAAQHSIPIVQNRALARALFREVEYEGFIPEKWYPQVAKIMVWVYVMRDARHATGAKAS